MGLRRGVPVRRAHRAPRRRRDPVLGRARHVELAEHRRAASPTRSKTAATRPRPRSRTAASGFLNTDWGDRGHLQQLPISDPGLRVRRGGVVVPRDQPRPRPRRRAQRARVRRPDRRARGRAARDRRRAPARDPADPEPLDPRDAPLLPADPRRARHHEGHHRRRARRGRRLPAHGRRGAIDRRPPPPRRCRAPRSTRCTGPSTC